MSLIQPPERHWAAEALVILGALLLVIPFVLSGYIHDDEMSYNSLANGMRIAHGQVLYRDFFEFGMPLPSWIAACFASVFGPQVVPPRLFQDSLLVLAAWQSHRLARWLDAGPWLAVLPAWVGLGCFHATVPGYNHHWLVLPIVLGALLAGMRAGEGLSARGWAFAGLLAGLAFVCMQSDGLVVTVALAMYAIGRAWLGAEMPLLKTRLSLLGLGWSVPVLLMLLWLATQGALSAFYQDVFRWTMTHYRTPGGINDIRYLSDLTRVVGVMDAVRLGVPLWYLRLLRYLLTTLVPALVAVIGFGWGLGLIKERLGGRLASALELRFGLMTVLAIGMFLVALRGRSDLEHLAEYGTPAFIVFGAIAGLLYTRSRAAWQLASALPALLLALFLASGLVQRADDMAAAPGSWWPLVGPDVRVQSDPTLRYLKAHARPGDRLVAVPAGGYYYFYALPAAVTMTTIFDKAARYYTPQEIDRFWTEVAASQARFLVVDPSNEPFLKDAFPGPPPGYRVVFEAPSWRHAKTWVTVYERR